MVKQKFILLFLIIFSFFILMISVNGINHFEKKDIPSFEISCPPLSNSNKEFYEKLWKFIIDVHKNNQEESLVAELNKPDNANTGEQGDAPKHKSNTKSWWKTTKKMTNQLTKTLQINKITNYLNKQGRIIWEALPQQFRDTVSQFFETLVSKMRDYAKQEHVREKQSREGYTQLLEVRYENKGNTYTTLPLFYDPIQDKAKGILIMVDESEEQREQKKKKEYILTPEKIIKIKDGCSNCEFKYPDKSANPAELALWKVLFQEFLLS
ncbi:hypothetical protein [Candidatus Phytoplasma meliae]|uniref:Effector n=1 Tax=Candidatus Phytoplasma meliae TaxID=1848402 RepID=A0ABS5CXE5_9MOLU|nr:hypothetical protein [Candidatus Phytoplasma meliae]MBP5835646.1 hypothetical protein [Candidatus Phytoplasma meliae]